MIANAISRGDYSPFPSNSLKKRQPSMHIQPISTKTQPASKKKQPASRSMQPASRSMQPASRSMQPSTTRLHQNLSTGSQLTRAAYGPSNLAISEKMTSQLRGWEMGVMNSENMHNLIVTAESGLSTMNEYLQRMRDLSLLAANDTLTQEDRGIVQSEIGQMLSGFTDVANATAYNGMQLLTGEFTNRNTASTPMGTGPQISINNMSPENLGIEGYNVTSGRPNTGALETAMNAISSERSKLGAYANTLQHTARMGENTAINLAAARSRISDTNMAKASTQLHRNMALEQYRIQMQKNRAASLFNAKG